MASSRVGAMMTACGLWHWLNSGVTPASSRVWMILENTIFTTLKLSHARMNKRIPLIIPELFNKPINKLKLTEQGMRRFFLIQFERNSSCRVSTSQLEWTASEWGSAWCTPTSLCSPSGGCEGRRLRKIAQEPARFPRKWTSENVISQLKKIGKPI